MDRRRGGEADPGAQREVVDADWVSFAVEGDPSPLPPTLCVLTEEELTSYSAGEAHATALPGPAGRIWPLSKGLLLQEVGSGRVWFLGGSLSELLRVVIPGPGEGLVLCFVSARGDEPYLVFFDSGRGEHRVFRYEYGREDSAAPGSVTSIRLQSLEMRWSSYQYPKATSWVGLHGRARRPLCTFFRGRPDSSSPLSPRGGRWEQEGEGLRVSASPPCAPAP